MRNSMGACAMVQVPRPMGGRGLSAGGVGGSGGVRGGGGGAGGGMFYPMAFSSPAAPPRYMYPPSPMPSPMPATATAAMPFYPASAPHQPYYDQPVGVPKRTTEQVQ